MTAENSVGELVIKADQASVSKAIGANPERAIDAPKESLQSKLILGLRHLVKNELRLNQPGASAWLTSDALWLVSKSVTDQLKAYLLSQGFEGIPHRNSRIFDEMQSHGIIQPTLENMAIWECSINDPERNWTQKLTMIKVAPALIWGTEARPECFTGTVEIAIPDVGKSKFARAEAEQAEAGDPLSTQTQAHSSIPPEPPPYEDDELAMLMQSMDSMGADADRYLPLLDSLTECESEPTQIQNPSALPYDSAPMARATEAAQDLGTQFVTWLRHGLQSQKIVINDVKAKVHIVAGTAFIVTPGIFQRFVLEHPGISPSKAGQEAWKDVQKQFQKLRLHRKTEGGLNIWKCTVTGQKRVRKLQGYLMVDPSTLFSSIPYDNPFLCLDAED